MNSWNCAALTASSFTMKAWQLRESHSSLVNWRHWILAKQWHKTNWRHGETEEHTDPHVKEKRMWSVAEAGNSERDDSEQRNTAEGVSYNMKQIHRDSTVDKYSWQKWRHIQDLVLCLYDESTLFRNPWSIFFHNQSYTVECNSLFQCKNTT